MNHSILFISIRNFLIYSILIIQFFFSSLVYSSPLLKDSSNIKPLRVYTTVRISEAPEIDGRLDDPCWSIGEWSGDYTQWIPDEGAKPSQPTIMKILHDDHNIYVAIRAYDSEPEKISRKAGRRDEFIGDIVGINFDSYHDKRTGFEFDLTAAGQQIDIILTNPSVCDFDWNAVWYGDVAMEDSAWTAEFRIPLSQLRYSSEEEQVWGIHVWRWIDRFQEESDWEPQSSTGPGALYLFGELHGLKNLPASRRIEIMPYTLGRVKTYQKEELNPYADKGRTWFGNAGIDAKIGITSNLTADLTINPDFGQVESDPSVMNLTAFETFYDEKRPFFLEGKNIFEFKFNNVNLFYSRRIGHAPAYYPELRENEYMDYPDNTSILSALKLSGKSQDGLAIGILQSFTSKEYAEISSGGKTHNVLTEPLTNYFVGRIQKDFEGENTILGGMITSVNRCIDDSHLEYLNKNAFTGGVDLRQYWNDKEFYIDAKLAGSTISGSTDAIKNLQTSSARYYQRPDASHIDYDSALTSLSGHAGSIKIGKGSKGLWRYSNEVYWRSPGFELNDLGYMNKADVFSQQFSISYFAVQPVFIFRTYNISLDQYNNWDYGMNYLSSGATLNISFEFLNRIAMSYNASYLTQALDTRLLRGGPAAYVPGKWSNHFYIRTDPGKQYLFEINSDVSVSENKNSEYYSINPCMSFRPHNTLRIFAGIQYEYNMDRLQYIGTEQYNNHDIYLLGKINQHTLGFTFRIDYNITPSVSIQYYGSPFASAGQFSEFKYVINPRSKKYDEQFSPVITVKDGDGYIIPEIASRFDNPDFNFSQFRSNLVFRWEYMPGSQLYLVWSNDKTYWASPGYDTAGKTLDLLRDVHPNNLFLLKFNYWFNI